MAVQTHTHNGEYRVEAFTHPLKDERVFALAPTGVGITELVQGLDHRKLGIWVNGQHIAATEWHKIFPQEGDTVLIRAIPQKDVLRTVLQIGVVLAAVWLAGPAGLGLTAGTVAHAAFVGGVILAGNLLLNALIPPAQPPTPIDQAEFTRLSSLTGAANRVGRFVPIPRLFGHMRYFPPIPMTGMPYTELVGDDQYLRVLLILGYGPLSINGVTVDNTGVKTLVTDPDLAEAIRIGETTIDNFEDVEVEVGDPASMTLFTQSIFEERVDLDMNSTTQIDPGTVTESISNIRTTQENVDEIAIDIEFPQGLFSLQDNGQDVQSEVSFTIEYRDAGSEDEWTAVDFDTHVWYWLGERTSRLFNVDVDGTTWAHQGRTRQTIRKGIRWPVENGQYEVRLTRIQTYNKGTNVGSTDARWLSLKSITKDRPFDMDNVVGLAMRIKASDQLSGQLDNISVEATSILDVWDGNDWVPTATSSPAWAFVDALTGVATRRPLNRDTDIDLDEMIAWAAQNASDGMEFNYVSEGSMTLFNLIKLITSTGRAAWGMNGNLITVIREEAEQTPRQLFSSRNARNFRLQKLFPKVPHALRVKFVDPTTWEDSERLVFDDGYTDANATLYETLELPGVTSAEQAWKLGRFHLAQMRLRPEIYTFDAYIDTLIAQRGDAIAIANDNYLDGLGSARIKSVTRLDNLDIDYPDTVWAGLITELEVDDLFYMEPGGDYKITIRYIPELQYNNDFSLGEGPGWIYNAGESELLDDPDNAFNPEVTTNVARVTPGTNGLRTWNDYRPIVTPGEQYTLRAWVKRDEDDLPNSHLDVGTRFDEADGTTSSGFPGTVSVSATISGWQFVETTFTVPADSVYMQARLVYTDPGDAEGAWYIGWVSLRRAGEEDITALVTETIATVSPNSSTLTPANPLPAGIVVGDLVTFGTSPIMDAKIVKILPGEDLEATIVAVPLAPEILEADTSEIPDYDPLLDQPVDFNKLPPPTPEVITVRSDESVLYRDSDGTLKVQLVVTYKFPPGQPETQVQMRITESDTMLGWRRYSGSSDEGKISTSQVLEGVQYDIQLRAINARGLVSDWSTAVQHTVVGKSSPPSDVTNLQGTLESFGILLTWSQIPDLDRSEYEVRLGETWDSALFLTRTAALQYQTGIKEAGGLTFLVKAIDTSGNESVNAASVEITVGFPSVANLALTFVGESVQLSWTGVTGAFAIAEYEVRRGGSDWDSATFVRRVRATTIRQQADWSGSEVWRVAAIDVAGNVGTAASTTGNVTLPSIQSVTPQVIDNNALLRWNPLQGTLPIVRYEVRKGETFASAEVVGIADTTFAAILEVVGGLFTYWVVPIDSAGNEGSSGSVQVQVDEPPDFVLNSDFHTDGLGLHTNVYRLSTDRRSILFNTSGDRFINLPTGVLDTLTDCTIEFAACFDEIPSGNRVAVAMWDGVAGTDAANTLKIWFSTPNADGTVPIWFRPYGATLSPNAAAWNVAFNPYDGLFHHYSFVRDQTGGEVELFINGVSFGTVAVTGMSALSASAVYLGINVSGVDGSRSGPFGGKLDEVRFWSDVRTSVEIGDFWNTELQLNEAGLQANYRFNLEGNQLTADDLSPNDYNGTFHDITQNLPIVELLLPFPSDETIEDKEDTHGYETPQEQVDDGYPYVIQPVPLTATITEVYNTGLVIPSSRIRVFTGINDVVGSIAVSVQISVKENVGDSWTDFSAGEADVLAEDFQYIKVVWSFEASTDDEFAIINQLDTRAFVKLVTDEGVVNFTGSPMTVEFNREFLDIVSITATPQGTAALIPVVDFTDAPNPTEFDIYLFNTSGVAQTSGTVRWVARGVAA